MSLYERGERCDILRWDFTDDIADEEDDECDRVAARVKLEIFSHSRNFCISDTIQCQSLTYDLTIETGILLGTVHI